MLTGDNKKKTKERRSFGDEEKPYGRRRRSGRRVSYAATGR